MSVARAVSRLRARAHAFVYRRSRGRVLNRLGGMPVVMVVTTGRRSGVRHAVMLNTPVVDGDRLLLVASDGGAERDPDWYRNLRAHREVEVLTRGRVVAMVARPVGSGDTSALWGRVLAANDVYEGYRQRAGREIPLVWLEPA